MRYDPGKSDRGRTGLHGPTASRTNPLHIDARRMIGVRHGLTAMALVAALAAPAAGNPLRSAALDAFAQHCFSPFLTAETANAAIAPTGARHDFYDLNPFSDVAPSPAATEITPGTDRRCEVALDGEHGAAAADVAMAALPAEGITRDAPLPATHTNATLPGTTLLAARFLNPNRIAVVHTGTRPGPNGIETFMSVERLTAETSREAIE